MTHPYHPQCGCATRRHMLGWAALASIGAITGLTGLTGCSQADNSSGPVDALASVFLDPAFMIDPAFALANPGYNLFVSADVGNPPFEVSAVPEPGGALMLVLGLGVVAWARRVSPAAA